MAKPTNTETQSPGAGHKAKTEKTPQSRQASAVAQNLLGSVPSQMLSYEASDALSHAPSALMQRQPLTYENSATTSGHSSRVNVAQRNFSAIPVHAADRPARQSLPLIQARLMVGPAHDQYEQEADRVAERVLQMSAPTFSVPPAAGEGGQVTQSVQRQDEEELQAKPLAASITPLVQRVAQPAEFQGGRHAYGADNAETSDVSSRHSPLATRYSHIKTLLQRRMDESFAVDSDFEQRLATNRGGGIPLPNEVRAYMEPRFGADFSGVRVHTDGESAQLNRAVSAQAFTHGQDIYLGEGKNDFASGAGKHLLAHELTHVIQQTGSSVQRRYAPASILPVSLVSQPVIHRYFETVDTENEEAVRKYIQQKLKDWSGLFSISKKRRRQKAAQLLRDAPSAYKDLVHELYQAKFGELITEELADDEPEMPGLGRGDEYDKSRRLSQLQEHKEKLELMRAEMEQGGLPRDFESSLAEIARFLGVPNPLTAESSLDIEGNIEAPIEVRMPGEKTVAGFKGISKQGKSTVDKNLASGLTMSASSDSMMELGARGKVSASTTREEGSVSGEFDLSGFAGLALRNKSEAQIQHALLGYVKGDILTLLKLGAGGNLSGKAKAALDGLEAQLIADAFLGAKLDVVANAEFGNDLVAIGLGGEIHGTAGVEANLGLSAALGKEGFEAAVKAGFFAGAKIEFKGEASLIVGKRRWGNVAGSASFSAGAGGEFEAGIKLNGSGFTVKFGADATIGVGAGTSVEFGVDLKNIGLSIKEARMILANYHTTKILGYESLNMQEATNLKALDDVLWVVNQQLGAAEKRRETIERGGKKSEKLLLL